MEINIAIKILSALAHETRLTIFRTLVQAGESGLPAGQLAKDLGIPNATLSFHLKELTHAELVIARQESRFIYYSANFATMNALRTVAPVHPAALLKFVVMKKQLNSI